MEIPETRYAKALDGTHLACKVLGDAHRLAAAPAEGNIPELAQQGFGASSPEPLAPNS